MTIYHGHEWGEIYDIEHDPAEKDNLWDNPGSANIKANLMEGLARQQMSLVDYGPPPNKLA